MVYSEDRSREATEVGGAYSWQRMARSWWGGSKGTAEQQHEQWKAGRRAW